MTKALKGNTKHKARNSKQIQSTNDQMTKTFSPPKADSILKLFSPSKGRMVLRPSIGRMEFVEDSPCEERSDFRI